ncbi:MAG: response regulator, partial [Magnetococcales bacterium]|nr:response regulator [Magnetococcales bacterium]
IVDDVPAQVKILAGILADDYTILMATRGADALRIAETRQPDLILLDVVMPDMSGTEVCQSLKANPATRSIPVIFVTAQSDNQDETIGLKLGAVDYIIKPFNPTIVQLRVKNQLLLKQYQNHLEDLVQQRTAQLQQTTLHLQQAMETAESSNRAKTRFLMVISHELRSPLNVIVGYSDLLTTMLEGEPSEYANNILSAGHRMTDIVTDVFEFVGLETRMVTLADHPYKIRDLISKTSKEVAKKYRSKGLTWTSTVAEEISDLIGGDETYTKQVLTRLLDNAYKFTHAGTVHLQVTLLRNSKQPPQLLFSIQDSGEGVALEQQEDIFSHFTYGAHDLTTEHKGGLGMGLAICRQIVALMNGRLWLEKSSPDGSEFCFAIPYLTNECVV